MATVSATRSMGIRLGKLKSAVEDLEAVLVELKTKEAINEAEAAHVQKLEQIVTKRWESLDDKWEELEDDYDNFKDANERDKCTSDYNDGKKTHGSILNSTRHVLSLPRATTSNVVQSISTATSSGPLWTPSSPRILSMKK